MTAERRAAKGIPLLIYGWFGLDAVLALTPPLHWVITGDARVLGVPGTLFYFVGVASFICASLVVAYSAEVAAGRFKQ